MSAASASTPPPAPASPAASTEPCVVCLDDVPSLQIVPFHAHRDICVNDCTELLRSRVAAARAGDFAQLQQCYSGGCVRRLLPEEVSSATLLAPDVRSDFSDAVREGRRLEEVVERNLRNAVSGRAGGGVDPLSVLTVEELSDFAELVRTQPRRYTMCPGCMARIDRTDGCNHMTHSCSANVTTHFCFFCGQVLRVGASALGDPMSVHFPSGSFQPCIQPHVRLLGLLRLDEDEAAVGAGSSVEQIRRLVSSGPRVASNPGLPTLRARAAFALNQQAAALRRQELRVQRFMRLVTVVVFVYVVARSLLPFVDVPERYVVGLVEPYLEPSTWETLRKGFIVATWGPLALLLGPLAVLVPGVAGIPSDVSMLVYAPCVLLLLVLAEVDRVRTLNRSHVSYTMAWSSRFGRTIEAVRQWWRVTRYCILSLLVLGLIVTVGVPLLLVGGLVVAAGSKVYLLPVVVFAASYVGVDIDLRGIFTTYASSVLFWAFDAVTLATALWAVPLVRIALAHIRAKLDAPLEEVGLRRFLRERPGPVAYAAHALLGVCCEFARAQLYAVRGLVSWLPMPPALVRLLGEE
jgi:hypothetical protein